MFRVQLVGQFLGLPVSSYPPSYLPSSGHYLSVATNVKRVQEPCNVYCASFGVYCKPGWVLNCKFRPVKLAKQSQCQHLYTKVAAVLY